MKPFPVEHPLPCDLDGLHQMVWPDPADPHRFADLDNLQPTSERLLVGEHPSALFQRAWLLVGMQPLLTAMTEQNERVSDLFARIARFEEGLAQKYIKLGIEAAWISDDYGISLGAAFSLDLWRQYVKSHLQQLVACYHEANVLVILHSFGSIETIIEDVLEIGIDVLDPLQPNCNKLDLIRQRTAGRICLCGGIESSLLFSGNVDKTRSETHRRIRELGQQGGYIVGPDDEWDYPASTHAAMLEAVAHYRDNVRRRRR